VIAMLVVIAMGAAGTGALLWQRAQLRDERTALATAMDELDAAHANAVELANRIEELNAKLSDADHSVKRVAKLEGAIADLEHRLTSMLGPALPDGRHVGFLETIGATQKPPKLVIDVVQFFTGPAADAAAKEDGALPPGEEHVPNDIYLRNETDRWRMLPIDPGTTVSLSSYPFGQIDGPLVVPLGRFAKIFENGKGAVRYNPYWITVRDGIVIAIDEQYVP
jgi:hypothetical protein